MKKILCIALLACASAAFASEDLESTKLNADNVALPKAESLVIRTAQTPKSVHVGVPIEFERDVCLKYEQQMEYGPDPYCGSYQQCYPIERCVQWETVNGHQRCVRTETFMQCHYYYNSCYHPGASYCVQWGKEKYTELRHFRLKFKNVVELKDGEEEIYKVRGYNEGTNHGDDKYEVQAISTKDQYYIKSWWFFGDWVTVKGGSYGK